MKKTYFLLAAAVVAVASSACSKKTDSAETASETSKTETTVQYAGTVPGADVDGVHYIVTFTAESDSTGVYDMTADYIKADTIAEKFTETGRYGSFDRVGTRYVKLSGGDATTYFRCDGDSALTMVNSALEASPTADYTLMRVK